MTRDNEGENTFDIFISYSRKDKTFTTALKKALERYSPPAGLDLPSRPPRVFLDEHDIKGPEYNRAIEEHLRTSASLLVICSPSSGASDYVNDEIVKFHELKDGGKINSVLYSGLPNNETDDVSKHAFPPALLSAHSIPLAADFRGFKVGRHRFGKPPYDTAWHFLLSNIYDVPREIIEGRELKRARRSRIRRVIAAAAVLIPVLGLTGWELWKRTDAFLLQHALQQGDKLADTLEPERRVWWIGARAANGDWDKAISFAQSQDNDGGLDHESLEIAAVIAETAGWSEHSKAYQTASLEHWQNSGYEGGNGDLAIALELDRIDLANKIFEQVLSSSKYDRTSDKVSHLRRLVGPSIKLGRSAELLDVAEKRLSPNAGLWVVSSVVESALDRQERDVAALAIDRGISLSARIDNSEILDDEYLTGLLVWCFQHDLSDSCVDLSEGLKEIHLEHRHPLLKLILQLLNSNRIDDAEQLVNKLGIASGVLGSASTNNLVKSRSTLSRGFVDLGRLDAAKQHFATALQVANKDVSKLNLDSVVELSDAALKLQDREESRRWARVAWDQVKAREGYRGFDDKLLAIRSLARAGLASEAVETATFSVNLHKKAVQSAFRSSFSKSDDTPPPHPIDWSSVEVNLSSTNSSETSRRHITGDLYKSGLKQLALVVARSSSAVELYLEILRATDPSTAKEEYMAVVNESIRHLKNVDELVQQLPGDEYREGFLKRLSEYSNKILTANTNHTNSPHPTAIAIALLELGDNQRAQQILIHELKRMAAETEHVFSIPQTLSLITGILGRLELSSSELLSIEEALNVVMEAMFAYDMDDMDEVIKFILDLRNTSLHGYSQAYVERLLSGLYETDFVGVDLRHYPDLVCAATLYGMNQDAANITELTAVEIRIKSYSTLVAGIASRSWPKPDNAGRQSVCNTGNYNIIYDLE